MKERTLEYRPAARHWWKLKKDYLDGMADTVDLLLLGAFAGTGARGGQLASFLMGCLEKSPASAAEAHAPLAWRTVCRVGSGLSASQLLDLQAPLHKLMQPISEAGPPPWLSVAPLHAASFYVTDPTKAPVWELAATSVLPSPHHTSGYSLRFPRFVRERSDKDWKTHTSLPSLRALVAPPPRRSFSSLSAKRAHFRAPSARPTALCISRKRI